MEMIRVLCVSKHPLLCTCAGGTSALAGNYRSQSFVILSVPTLSGSFSIKRYIL